MTSRCLCLSLWLSCVSVCVRVCVPACACSLLFSMNCAHVCLLSGCLFLGMTVLFMPIDTDPVPGSFVRRISGMCFGGEWHNAPVRRDYHAPGARVLLPHAWRW